MRTITTTQRLGTLGIACQSASDPKPKVEPEVTKAEPSSVERPAGTQGTVEATLPVETADDHAVNTAPTSVGAARVGITQNWWNRSSSGRMVSEER